MFKNQAKNFFEVGDSTAPSSWSWGTVAFSLSGDQCLQFAAVLSTPHVLPQPTSLITFANPSLGNKYINFFSNKGKRQMGWEKWHGNTLIQIHNFAIHLLDPQDEGSNTMRNSTSDNFLLVGQRLSFPGWGNVLTSVNHGSFDERVKRGTLPDEAGFHSAAGNVLPCRCPHPPSPQDLASMLDWCSHKDERQA